MEQKLIRLNSLKGKFITLVRLCVEFINNTINNHNKKYEEEEEEEE